MTKHVITIEDCDGGVWISCDPSVEEMLELCKTPERMTSADGYAAEVHITLRRTSERALADLPAPSITRN